MVYRDLPAGMPHRFNGPSAWVGAKLAKQPDIWLTQLSQAYIDELVHAGRAYLETGRDIGDITKDDFPLPTFSTYLAAMRIKLVHGVGVEVLRGLPVDDFDKRLSAAIFCGIGAHLGSARSQNAAGHILGHVRDTGADARDENTRIYQTNARQSFHTDSADVVGLLCLKEAKEGGDSLLVSAETIFNKMAEQRPDLLALLFDPIATDRRGEIPVGMKPFMTIPPLNWYGGKLTVFYQRQYIDAATRFEEAMRLSEAHIEALNLFDDLCDDPDLHIKMRLTPGDMQFVYNHSQLHDRTGFIDWPEPENRRHLLRLWLSIPDDRLLPYCFKQRYGTIETGHRGGIITEKTRLHAPLD